MKKLIVFLLLSVVLSSNTYAANWVKLRESSGSKLTLDKQSIVEKDALKRAWFKIEYQSSIKNHQTPEKEFNVSKLLWFFDCPAQKTATSKVFQYLNDELVYSAAIEIKNAEFIEPVPETDLDIAMRIVCAPPKPIVEKPVSATKPKPSEPEKKEEPAPAKVEPKPEVKVKPNPETKPTIDTTKFPVKKPEKEEKKSSDRKTNVQQTKWSYEGKEGPENWAKLNENFSTCETGQNQSPINIDNSTKASLKPLKLIQRYAVKQVLNNEHTIQTNFKEGNLLFIENTSFRLNQLSFHAPSEHQIKGKSFPLEAHFIHTDKKDNIAIIGVMFIEGKANPALESLLLQMPSEAGEKIDLKSRVIASELMPTNRSYYHFNGSLTTPPCSEGVRWFLMKTPITASKEQMATFEKMIKHPNNRPLQPVNGRIIIE